MNTVNMSGNNSSPEHSDLSRRDTLKLGAAGVVVAAATACGLARAEAALPATGPAPDWLTLLGQSETGGRDYAPDIEGDLPQGLTGSLYRNGPGLFERGGVRKPHLLDGDGLVQRLSFADGQVRYQNAFVRTSRFEKEQAAGKYLQPSWSMRKPGGMLANIGTPHIGSQAGVTVYPFNGELYAFDEITPAYLLDPASLATLGTKQLGDPAQNFMLKAHTKIDPVTGDWLLTAITHGPTMKLHAIVHGADGRLKSHQVIDSPRQVYLHDFFATEHYFVFALQPLYISLLGLLSGTSSYIEAMKWRGADGTLVMIVPRDGGAPRTFEAAGAFMWHALNAFERGTEIVADFVAYGAPDHFAGHDALMVQLMLGKLAPAKEAGTLRRYRIDLRDGKLREEILSADTHEFPIVDPRRATLAHRIGYMTAGGLHAINTGVKRLDFETGKTQAFDFGSASAVGEPVFAAKPASKDDEGWLITQVLDGETKKTVFAIFDAQSVEAGPIAKVRLTHSLPISFHGWWNAA
jgi:all-trans-8'-apo-beta-carotenal 15,15'-oxygenase